MKSTTFFFHSVGLFAAACCSVLTEARMMSFDETLSVLNHNLGLEHSHGIGLKDSSNLFPLEKSYSKHIVATVCHGTSLDDLNDHITLNPDFVFNIDSLGESSDESETPLATLEEENLSLFDHDDVRFVNQLRAAKHKLINSDAKVLLLNFDSLHEIKLRYGKNSKQFAQATRLVKDMINMYHTELSNSLPDTVSITIVKQPEHFVTDVNAGGNFQVFLGKRDFFTNLQGCAPDLATCESDFNNCTNHGSCVEETRNNQVCFFCQCNTVNLDDNGNPREGYVGPVNWSGDSCQFQDLSTEFHLLFWTGLALFVILLWSVSLLNSTGEGNGVEGSYGKSKTE